jgi:recombination protein RecT
METKNDTAVAGRKPAGQVALKGLGGLLKQDGIMARVEALLGDRAPQFTSSLLALTNSSRALSECDPKTVLASAMVAATMDLPINPNLGFAYIVPYGGVAQFQMGWKGFVQLAMRSGQYARMNAVTVNAEALAGVDEMGEPVIAWEKLDETKPAIGYVFGFKLVNGYTKIAYWSKAKVEAHAQRYSQAYRAKKKDSPWFTNFDAMGMKTVTKNTLAKWGVLSIAMERAITEDTGTRANLDDAPPMYLDNAVDVDSTVTGEDSAKALKDRITDAPPVDPDAAIRAEAVALVEKSKAAKVADAMKAAGIKEYEDGEAWEGAPVAKIADLVRLLKM